MSITSSSEFNDDIVHSNNSLRPMKLDDFTGQSHLKENLKAYILGAVRRKEMLDHTIFSGPPGLGKTTLAQVVANELGVDFSAIHGATIKSPGELASILVGMQQPTVLFIDEIHALPKAVCELLYPALEDFVLDLQVGEEMDVRTVRMPLQPFTMIAATTQPGSLPKPLLDRLGNNMRLRFYSVKELTCILQRDADLKGLSASSDGLEIIAKCSRGTPRVAKRMLRRVVDHMYADDKAIVDKDVALSGLHKEGVDAYGLDEMDRSYLNVLANVFKGRPVGLSTIATATHQDSKSVEETIEPYLMSRGLIEKTPKGRKVTGEGIAILEKIESIAKIPSPAEPYQQSFFA